MKIRYSKVRVSRALLFVLQALGLVFGINWGGVAPGRGGARRVLARSGRDVTLVFGTFDLGVYATGGDDLTTLFSQFKRTTNATNLYIFVQSRAGFIFDVDYTNKKLVTYQFNYPGGAAGAATEVPNATNLAAVTGVRFLAVGVAA